MDCTYNYIKMCRGAEEIQKKSLSTGDFFYIPPYANCGTTGSLIYTDNMKGHMVRVEFVFLPRQDQLQEMLSETCTIGGLINEFHDFYEPEQICPDEDDEHPACQKCIAIGSERRKTYDTMEQLWLAFVMSELYTKKWNGAEWLAF